MVSQYFRSFVKMDPKPGRTSFIIKCKMTAAMLISHFREMFIDIFRKIKCNEE